MRKLFLIGIVSLSFLLVACGGEDKKLVCSYDGEVIGANQKVEVTLDSNDKVSKIEIVTVYETEEEAKQDYEGFKIVHGDNAVLDANTITVKNAHDSSTFFGKSLSEAVGYSKDDFQTFIQNRMGNYICK